ncbi:hypothetical protein J5N97_010180 [Dioscorea zingiberensis]|uniref:Uncharacterized protein n=1 Tax=Dioscorea zingiberensis TaxID=325984 RepID=A0A9D5D0V1_9LILI|nr:hypothetical protein J5N97_010180 [Dioscorea zingiberensis]
MEEKGPRWDFDGRRREQTPKTKASIMKRLTLGRRLETGDRNSSNLTRGHVRVHVGKKVVHKLEMDANILNHPLFYQLLRQSVEEFGYSYSGALRIACEINVFLHLVSLLESGRPEVHYMELQDLIRMFSNGGHESDEEENA